MFIRDDLKPMFSARNRLEYDAGMGMSDTQEALRKELSIVERYPSQQFYVKGFCLCCNSRSEFLVDYAFAWESREGVMLPNWRERLVCKGCNMNNRQRLVASQASKYMDQKRLTVYFMEQVTPIFNWTVKRYPSYEIFGSEYLGPDYRSGEVHDGIRHEDIMALSFPSKSIDLIISNDVFEHIPKPVAAFKECYRALRPGGVMLATIPFDTRSDQSVTRAEIVDNQIRHLLPACYHANPISEQGSLVFFDYGWDLFHLFAEAGFRSAQADIFRDHQFGHHGSGLLIFKLVKR